MRPVYVEFPAVEAVQILPNFLVIDHSWSNE